MNEWINCSDRLPDNSYNVLTCHWDSASLYWSYDLAFFAQGDRKWFLYNEDHPTRIQITHWMPLPTAPKDVP